MKQLIIYILFIPINYNYIECDNKCPAGWDAYDDQLKCIKIFINSIATYDNAINKCAKLAPGSTLLTIHSPEEQEYLTNYLYVQNKIVNSLWLGARVKQQIITWMDNTNGTYTNWITGRPVNSSDVKCIEMQSENMIRLSADDKRQGKWFDTDCKKRSMVVCQLIQSVQISDLVKLIMETRNQLDNKQLQLDNQQNKLNSQQDHLENNQLQLDSQQNKLNSQQDQLDNKQLQLDSQQNKINSQQDQLENNQLKLNSQQNKLNSQQDQLENKQLQLDSQQNKLNNQQDQLDKQKNTIEEQRTHLAKLESNPVPVGFIYTQLSGQPEPCYIWPQVKWQEVTRDYSGLFFLAEGSGSLPFGQIQPANWSRLAAANAHRLSSKFTGDYGWRLTDLPVSGWSEIIYSWFPDRIQLYFTESDYRPRNQAIRLFKRIQ